MSDTTTFEEYNKKSKKELINLLIEKDQTVKDLKSRIDKIEKQIQQSDVTKVVERVTNIERSAFQQQQYSRRETIELVGLPDNLDGEALEDKVVEVFKHAGVEVEQRDFHAIHRLSKKSVVIAKCVNRRDAIAILRAKKNLREMGDDDRKKLGVRNKIYVNESLCPEFRRLFGICNALHKQKKINSFFTVNGSIKVTCKEGGEKSVIGHMEDLYKLVGEKVVKGVLDAHKKKDQ